ncbi:MAG: hypothetical protein KGO96_12805 [Elusimicrobia bacterium]|nr:hypothetical protein [Elusimicrobiota bacterium]
MPTFDDHSSMRISRSVLWTEAQRPQTPRVQNLARQSAVAGMCRDIRFVIVGADISGEFATCDVVAVDYGFQQSDVYGIDVNGTVEVYDPTGCFFNEPNASLTGRMGSARLRQPLGVYGADPVDHYNVPQWEVYSLCCLAVC